MKRAIQFLDNLQENNYREWFEDHKEEYKEAQAIFNDTVDKLIAGIATFDPSVGHLTARNCTFRIYRDVRFSRDKAPYKTHMGAFISPKGKGGGYSGYYFHIEAKNAAYIGGHILSAGIYRPEPVVLKNIREEIFLNGEQFEETIGLAKGFNLELGDSLKRVPNGYPADFKYAQYLKLKDFFLSRFVDDNFMTSPDLVERAVKEFRKTLEFHQLLNKVTDYALE